MVPSESRFLAFQNPSDRKFTRGRPNGNLHGRKWIACVLWKSCTVDKFKSQKNTKFQPKQKKKINKKIEQILKKVRNSFWHFDHLFGNLVNLRQTHLREWKRLNRKNWPGYVHKSISARCVVGGRLLVGKVPVSGRWFSVGGFFSSFTWRKLTDEANWMGFVGVSAEVFLGVLRFHVHWVTFIFLVSGGKFFLCLGK